MSSVRRRWNSSCPASPPLSPARSPCLHPTQLHTGTRDPICPSALPLPPHTNANVHHSYSYSRPHMRTRMPHRRRRSPEALAILTNALLASFGKDDTICGWRPSYTSSFSTSYTSPSTHSTHAVASPVSPHRYTSAPTPTPVPTYTSTLTPATPPGIPPTTRSVSSPPAPVRTSTSLTSGGKPKFSAGEEAESRLFPFLCSPHPMHRRRRHRVHTRSPPTARFRGWVRGGRWEGENDEDAWVDEGDDEDRDREGDEDLATPVL
ncbi:hypothetical protein B0H14DRAFT_3864339 [Mycena olivaceomarginata]|nr:hypothetical protein B0H14DRAFT_3864339 [Mycena olivaceomarginata]